MGNFEFLKNADNNVYKIINEAENYTGTNILNSALYRQENLLKMSVKTF